MVQLLIARIVIEVPPRENSDNLHKGHYVGWRSSGNDWCLENPKVAEYCGH